MFQIIPAAFDIKTTIGGQRKTISREGEKDRPRLRRAYFFSERKKGCDQPAVRASDGEGASAHDESSSVNVSSWFLMIINVLSSSFFLLSLHITVELITAFDARRR